MSAEDRAHAVQIDHLLQIWSPARFISFEPLLGPIGPVDLAGIAWVIVGGESGPGSAGDRAGPEYTSCPYLPDRRIISLRYSWVHYRSAVNAFPSTQFGNTVLAMEAFQYNADFFSAE